MTFEAPKFSYIQITPDNAVNGQNASYNVTFTPTVNLYQNDSIIFEFPPAFGVFSNVQCTLPKFSPFLKAVACRKPSNSTKIQANLILTDGIYQQPTYTIIINKIRNPPSTQPTKILSVRIKQEGTDGDINSYAGEDIIITNTQAATINGTLTIGNQNLAAVTDYTIAYVTANFMPKTASFLVKFPLEMKIQENVTCSITIPSSSAKTPSQTLPLPCIADVDTVVIRGGLLPTSILAGTKISLKISSIKNPDTIGIVSTLTLISFTDETLQYSIDQITKGLIAENACDYPCATCSAKSRTTCLSCITNKDNIAERYLSSGRCVSSCPDGYFNSNFTCTKCAADCKTCTNGATCTSCDTSVKSKIRYMNSASRCIAACPAGQFGNVDFYCDTCDSNCAACASSATNCVACPAANPLLSRSKTCVTQCSAGEVAIKSVCTACKAPCSECMVRVDQCKSCANSMYLVGTKCYSSCPSGFKADNSTTSTVKQCLGCDPNCSKCSLATANTVSTCTVCKKPMVLLGSTCISACPEKYKSDGVKCVAI
ncbi:hypothetical protein FGO68_gene3328 [Halteria grandinella]|uniref:Uncharacterized protein n=1 Tax=Halteria grandinella TaxID=5974 RepID=A0A8J8P8U4_HALGN|nr:hypothetical protein FGO68_gene3328 [Halteria grandinella]